jgi:hypothetical protein
MPLNDRIGRSWAFAPRGGFFDQHLASFRVARAQQALDLAA